MHCDSSVATTFTRYTRLTRFNCGRADRCLHQNKAALPRQWPIALKETHRAKADFLPFYWVAQSSNRRWKPAEPKDIEHRDDKAGYEKPEGIRGGGRREKAAAAAVHKESPTGKATC